MHEKHRKQIGHTVSESKRRIQETVRQESEELNKRFPGCIPPLSKGDYVCDSVGRVFRHGGKLRAVAVLEEKLGRPIKKGYDTHHKNRNTLDDRPENLKELRKPTHARLHNPKILKEA